MHLSRALKANDSLAFMYFNSHFLLVRDLKLPNFVNEKHFIYQFLLFFSNLIFLFIVFLVKALFHLFIFIHHPFICHFYLLPKLNHFDLLLLHIPKYQRTVTKFQQSLFYSFDLLFIFAQKILFYLNLLFFLY